VQIGPRQRDVVDRIDFSVDPDAEPGDVLGALARLLISIAQESVKEEQGPHGAPTH
jgi:hypothetical protein